jgi:curli biogenesis system outer membrane secretion channel CsgG
MNRKLAFLLLVTLSLTSTFTSAENDYVAYSETKKEGEQPLPENAREIVKKNAKKLVGVRWGDYTGRKIRVGVLDADNQSGTASFRWNGGEFSAGNEQIPVNGIDALLSDVMAKTSRFTVLTRTGELDNILDEQDLGDSGRVAKPSAAKIGKVLGAQYLVQLVINSYQPNVGGKKVGLGGFSRKLRAVGGAKVGKNKSYVQMTFKLIDAETSELVASEVIEANISDMSLGFGGGGWGGGGMLGGFMSGYSKTPIGQATMAAINIGVLELVKQVGNLPIVGSVVKVDADKAIVNLGEGSVVVGDLLKAVSMGEEFIDPDTGLSLGAEEEAVGALKVTSVKEKFCYVEAVGFDLANLTRGDKVLTNKEPQPLKFGPDWEK